MNPKIHKLFFLLLVTLIFSTPFSGAAFNSQKTITGNQITTAESFEPSPDLKGLLIMSSLSAETTPPTPTDTPSPTETPQPSPTATADEQTPTPTEEIVQPSPTPTEEITAPPEEEITPTQEQTPE